MRIFPFRLSFSLRFKDTFLYFIMIFISLRGKRRNRIWILSMPKSVARNKVDPARGELSDHRFYIKTQKEVKVVKKKAFAIILTLAMVTMLVPITSAANDPYSVRQMVLDETANTGSLRLYYDDRFPVGECQVSLGDQQCDSKKAGTNEPDDAVITKVDNQLIATGCGTCMATFSKEGVSYSVTITVTAAPISLVMVTGHSLGAGEKGNPTESVVCEAGQAYSTYAKAGDLAVDNASDFVPAALGYGDSKTTVADINAFTSSGDGVQGEDSALAYYWNQLTGEKIWVLNAARSGSCLQNYWLPSLTDGGHNNFWRAVALFKAAENVLSQEVTAGHYELKHMGIINHSAANGDEGLPIDDYTAKYLSMWNGFKSKLQTTIGGVNKTVDFLGITPFWQSVNTTALNNAKIVNYYMGTSAAYSDIYITTDIGRQWGSDAGVQTYFKGKYPSGTVDYPTHSGSIQLPTRRGSGAPQESADKQNYGTDTVFGDISHYRQVGYNEIGKDMAHNLVSSLYGQSSAQSVVVTKRDGKAIDPAQTLLMTPGETLELTLMPNPVSVNDLEIVCTGNALQRTSENAFVYQCVAGGTGEIQVKQGGRTLASYTVKCVSGAWYRWHFSK